MTKTTLFSHPLMTTDLACHKDKECFDNFQQSMGLNLIGFIFYIDQRKSPSRELASSLKNSDVSEMVH